MVVVIAGSRIVASWQQSTGDRIAKGQWDQEFAPCALSFFKDGYVHYHVATTTPCPASHHLRLWRPSRSNEADRKVHFFSTSDPQMTFR